ncbi:hypothetical protein [Sinomonas humi]|uniref:hypothetical protein n=1 Tax=Sinomonas humi TaxID=1338436 RepID=UPI0012DFF7A3|nr:hypothetical protein [Sinomonas humi]
MPRRRSLRSDLYRAARVLGDVQAAERGPGALGKREVRKAAYRRSGSLTGAFLRALGLMGGRRR